jgi:hypothetical protein
VPNCPHDLHGLGRKPKKEKGAKNAKKPLAAQQQGPGVELKKLKDKKLKGRLKHSERVFREAQTKAAKANEWLQTAEPGFLETEGQQLIINCARSSTPRRRAAQQLGWCLCMLQGLATRGTCSRWTWQGQWK